MFDFAQKELAPHAAEIDKKNEFTQLRVRKHFIMTVRDYVLFVFMLVTEL